MVNARENLGPAERIIQTLLTYSDHIYHGRPGCVTADPSSPCGATWKPVTWKLEEGERVVYELQKVGKKQMRTKLGVLDGEMTQHGEVVLSGGRRIGEYRLPGLFCEAATWVYRQIAEVWKLDNEFAAKWASYAWAQEHRDLKVALAAFMLVQARKGDPIIDGGKVAFHDDDFRDVGEAMLLINAAKAKDDKGLAHSPKMLLRIHELLTLPEVAAINRELGFGHSTRKPFLGRWPKAVEKWLVFREENPKMFAGLVKEGWSQSIRELARRIGYKPQSPKFFEALRWKQTQADDGRRTLLDVNIAAAETWAGKSEREICELITKDKPSWKRISALLPPEVGVTRAIVAAAVEAGSLSNKDLVIMTPTLEELGLTTVEPVKSRWEAALKAATDMRSANVAKNVRNTETKDKLAEAADNATQKAVAEVVKNIRIYFLIDISGSMKTSIDHAKRYIARFLPAFPPSRLHVCVFNTVGRIVVIKHASGIGVDAAFTGISASGGTSHSAGVLAFAKHLPKDDEDVIMIFVGDEGERTTFEHAIQATKLRPMAFGMLRLPGDAGAAVTTTARILGIPCFELNEKIFDDAYAVPRTLRNLIAATPITAQTAPTRASSRRTLVDEILSTKLLAKPAWA